MQNRFQDVEEFLFATDVVTSQLLEFPYYFQGTTGPPGPRGREVSGVIRLLYWHQMAHFFGSLPALLLLANHAYY